jgi:predicted protein tyrosine phosphatase
VTRALFVCGQNRLRSPTAEHVFAGWPGVETASAGLKHDSETPLTPELLQWADIVFVMERAQRARLSAHYRRWLDGKRVVCLDIADKYTYMQPALVSLLEARAGPHLRR